MLIIWSFPPAFGRMASTGRHAPSILVHKVRKLAQLVGATGAAELQQGLPFNLAYPLSSQLKYVTNFLQSVFLPCFIQAVSHAHDLLFTGRQQLQGRIYHLSKIM